MPLRMWPRQCLTVARGPLVRHVSDHHPGAYQRYCSSLRFPMPSSRFLAAAMLLAAGSVSLAGTAKAQAAAPTRPTLVVYITVDQMRADYLPRFASQLTGGLGRFYRGGAVFTNAFQDHAITETAPGHSVTLSGRFPRSTGIVTNSRGVPDSQTSLVDAPGMGASPFRFQGSTLIDWMRTDDPRSRALSVSRKDRGAILPLGRAHQSVFWYAPNGHFTTSTYYADTLPTWVQRFNARRIHEGYAGKAWTLLLAENAYPEPDSVPIESAGRDFTFPHPFPATAEDVAAALPAYPQMDSVTAQAALAGVEAMNLGRGPQPDLLAISFSTTDAVGHRFGPDSRELHDQILRLDRYLGQLIDSLYKIRDSSRIVFALSADHGVAPYPELHAGRAHVPAERVDIGPAVRSVDSQLRARGIDEAATVEEGIVILNRDAIRHAGLPVDSVRTAFATALRAVPGVARVDDWAALRMADTATDFIARRWLHMIPATFPADLVVTMDPYAYPRTTSATHGSPYDYDAHVPEVYYGAMIAPGKYDARALVADIAPTLAAIIGVRPTERLDGRVRVEAIQKQ